MTVVEADTPLGIETAGVLAISRNWLRNRRRTRITQPLVLSAWTDPMKIRLTRRQAAIILITVCGGAAAAWWETARREQSALELSLPPPGDPNAPSFEVFVALSQIVLLRDQLDESAARRMYELFVDEPWGPKHVHTAYKALRAAIVERNRKADRMAPAPLNALGPGEKWFVSHLVTTWYLGVYYHEQRPTQRVTYTHALMFDAIRGTLPIPYLESTGFGAWAELPPGISKPKS